MKLLGVAVGLSMSLSGCLWANPKSEAAYGVSGRALIGEDGTLQGGVADASFSFAGLGLGLEVNGHDVGRPEDNVASHAVGFAFDLVASLPGILAPTHRNERFFDLGFEGGAGGIVVFDSPRTPNPLTASAAHYGTWFEIGTFPVAQGYIAIVADVRRDAYGAPWSDQTQLTVGLAWRHREPLGTVTWRD